MAKKLFFILVLFVVGVCMILVSSESEGYTQSHSIQGATGAGTNYQMRYVLAYDNDTLPPVRAILPKYQAEVGNNSISSQDVDVDDTYLYFTQSDSLHKHWKSNFTSAASLWEPAEYGTNVMNHSGGVYVDAGLLYVTCNDFEIGHTGAKETWVKIFYSSNLTYKEEHYLGDQWSDGVHYWNSSWWASWDSVMNMTRYDMNWDLIANYSLSYTVNDTYMYDSLDIDNATGTFYVANHGTDSPYYLDCYRWNGSGFDEVKRYDTVSSLTKHTQGFAFDTNENFGWWVERQNSGVQNTLWNVSVVRNPALSDPSVVSLHGHCNENFSDIRFTDTDYTNMSYWIEEKTDGQYAIVWVNISSDLTTNQTIYLTYGDPTWESESNGTNTFIFFDDFTTYVNGTRWETLAGTPAVTDGVLLIDGDRCEMNTGTGESGGRRFVSNAAIMNNVSFSGVSIRTYGSSDNYFGLIWYSSAPNWQTDSEVGGAGVRTASSTYGIMGYHNYEYVLDDNATAFLSGYEINTHIVPVGDMGFYYASSAPSSPDIYVDYCFIGKFQTSEPTPISWSGELVGEEEEEDATVNGTSTESNSIREDFPIVVVAASVAVLGLAYFLIPDSTSGSSRRKVKR